ncbi:hypothetical protein BJX63DRAFT_444037 [Aspergillus granulosus]|uniref:Arrestin C-terminal-like domain-containing protein n=1 Tax=Aspergillus granulosus TaxID=176169 RepID=A0ABR4H856_9EURO
MFGTDIASYDLHLDQSTIFLPAQQPNGSSTFVTGQFHLSLNRATPFKRIMVRVIGRMKTPRYGLLTTQVHEETVFERTQNLASSMKLDSFTMPAGHYNFTFEIPLNGIPFETLAGLGHDYHTYTVEVVIERRMAWDLVVSQPLLVYKYPAVNIPLPLQKAAEENANKDIQHYISIPDTLVRHGSVIPVECWVEPLLDHVTITSISVRVHERHDLCFDATAAESMRYDTNFITWHHDYILCAERCEFPGQSVARIGEHSDLQQITIPVRLPERLDSCSQSFSSRHIKIEHLLVVEIEYQVGKTAGMSKVTRTIPIYIYMASRPDECHETWAGVDLQWFKEEHSDPPSYGQHQLDQIVSGLTDMGTRVEV